MDKPLGDFPFVLVMAFIAMVITLIRVGLWHRTEGHGFGYFTGGFWFDRTKSWGTKFRYATTQYMAFCIVILVIWIVIAL